MSQISDYKGLSVVTPTPSNLGGRALKDDLEELADRSGPVFETTADPTVDDDSDGTAGNGEFFLWSKWLNTTTAKVFVCVDPTPEAAIWKEITGGGSGGSPGGASTQLQFNDAGNFGGDANLTFDKVTDALALNGSASVDNLKLDGNTLSSTDTDGPVHITPNGTGNVVLDGLNWPNSDGSVNQVLSTDGSGNLSWTTGGSGGSPGGANQQVQFNNSGSFSGDANFVFDNSTDALTIVGSAEVDNLKLDGNTLSSTDTNGPVNITPDGTGNVVLDGLNWPTSDGSANQVLSTDGSGNLSWATSGGGGLSYWDEATGIYSGQEWVSLLPDSTLGTNVLAIIGGKGNLGLSMHPPDGSISNGNVRGAYAIDLQSRRTQATQVAGGVGSLAVGTYNTASGGYGGQVAVGKQNTATETNAVSVGVGNAATSTYSVALGKSNSSEGDQAVAVGNSNEATGEFASAFGFDNTASGDNSVAVGYRCPSSGENSSALGHRAKTTTDNTLEIGYWTDPFTRATSIRCHPSGMVGLTIQNRASEYSDGGATAGSEADNTLPREMYALRRDGDDIYLDVNIGGTVKNLSLGTVS